jgi:hypothetical protein
MRDFLDDISGPIETDPEGAPKVGPLRLNVLVVGEKLGPQELEAGHNGLTAELYRRGLLRCGFEEENRRTRLSRLSYPVEYNRSWSKPRLRMTATMPT